jgi:transposase
MLYLGIDVGKRWHEAALLDEAETVVWRLRFAPTRTGLALLGERRAGLTPAEVIVGLEATGVYWLSVHASLLAWGAGRVLVLNPLQTRAFRNANLRGSKTDRIDAVAIARLLRWEGRTLSDHLLAEERQQAARELHRLRVEMIELRAQQLVRLGAVLDRSFPEFAAHFADLGSKTALAVLARWPTPAALAQVAESELVTVLRHASRGHSGADKATALRAAAQASVGIADPLDAAALAIRALVGHLGHLSEQINALGARLDALLATRGSRPTTRRSRFSPPSPAWAPRRSAPGSPRPRRSRSSARRTAPTSSWRRSAWTCSASSPGAGPAGRR